ncbi:MAG: hypothetical protein HKN12_04500, partial [Gemmatimonadetes bacterium]|nr:hypothetical protein [Gemmatimonadota bacterium]
QKTHEFWLSFGPEATAPASDRWRSPLRVLPTPESVLGSGISLYLLPPADGATGSAEIHERLVAQAVRGPDTFLAKRERADEYGWRNFGELWADHESKYDDSGDLFVSHYNNQYDVVYGAFLQYARTGDERWIDILEPLARHAMDIDIYHTDEDRTVYNRGLFWHTAHYVRAGLATHRSYPKGDTVGGGPDNEHNYASGFAHYYFLTGDRQGREAAIERAQWILDADDGDKDRRFRLLHRGPTGFASKTREAGFHGPGRGAGNSIQVLMDAWRLTAAERFLAKAEQILRRTIHPEDDPGAMDLADSENRWSYTVHLQAVGRMLDELAEAEQLGELYAYGRECLLRYARWMAEHERPALDFPDRLDHPTETWAAQDLRKSEVFRYAMLHSDGEERDRFRERAEFFHHHSLETLDGFETKSYTRPVTLLLRYGLMQAYFDAHPDARRPDPQWSGSFAPRKPFVPQKAAAIRKAAWIAAGAGAVLVAGLAAYLGLR